MTYQPSPSEPMPPMVSPLTLGLSNYAHERYWPGDPTSANWETADRAVYVAILVPATCVVRRLWWANGATVSASYNVDVGIYGDAGYKPGARLVSTGSTAQGTASQVQFVDVTDTVLTPGRYWLAITCSSQVATFMVGGTSNNALDGLVGFQQASAMPLPTSATPVERTGGTNIYLCGFATTASP